MDVTLSDDELCSVRRLGIFELDCIDPPSVRPFTYTVFIGENEITKEYDVSAWEEPPDDPTPEQKAAPEGSVEWFYYFEWALYWGAVYREKEIREDTARYLNEVQQYILNNCIEPEDKDRIITPEDYLKIYHAALAPQLSMDDLQQALYRSFRATFDGENVLKKLLADQEEGIDGARYNSVRSWEIQALNQSGMTEDAWSLLSLEERARRVVAFKLDDWMSYLSIEKQRKEKQYA